MKLPLIHTTLVMAVIVSIAFLISLFTFNLVVLNKMNKIQSVLELFPDHSHLSKFKQENSSKILKDFDQKRQIMVTTQTIGFLILFMLGFRLAVLLSCLCRPQKGSKFSFMRRPYEEIHSVLEENTKEPLSVHFGIAEQKPVLFKSWSV